MLIETGNKPRHIRYQNTRIILDLFRNHPSLSVADISRRINLSRTTVMKIVENLRGMGIIRDAGKGLSSEDGGKKPLMYKLISDKHMIFAFHIKYKIIHFRMVNLKYETVFKADKEIESNAPFEKVLSSMEALFKSSRESLPKDYTGPLAFIIAVHGIVDTRRGICRFSTHFPSWGQDLPVTDLIKGAFAGEAPVYVDNWIRFKIFAEKETGLARGLHDVILIDAGRHGVTAGILINHKLYRGRHHLAGEIGHIILDPEDQRHCVCGSKGCFESMIACDRLVESAVLSQTEYPGSLLFTHSPAKMEDGKIDVFDIFRAADEGDELARRLLCTAAKWFSQGLAAISLIFDPQVIILEGDYASGGSYFREKLVESLRARSLPRLKQETPVLFNEAHPKATLEGAAIYAAEHLLYGALGLQGKDQGGEKSP